MQDVVISGAKRTPMGGFQGVFSSVQVSTLGATAIKAAVADARCTPDDIDEVLIGQVLPAGSGQAPARQACLGAGLPKSTPATAITKVCGSGMSTLDPLEDDERGVIINTASIAAFEGQMGQIAYAASKGGVAAMTLPMARDMAKLGVRIMAVAPGIFLTPMINGMPQEVQDALAGTSEFPKRLGQPIEFARLVETIATNTMLNGVVIRLDDGTRMQAK